MSDVHEEAEHWSRGDREASFYETFVQRSLENPLAQHGDGPLNKVLKPEDMPWELSRQGLIKHMLNADLADELDYPAKGTDLYMQFVPAGSRSGKHRHMGEEVVFVLEGEGYDLHWDTDIEPVTDDDVQFVVSDEPKQFAYRAGDAVYIPTNTIHQHVNDGDGPLRFISAQARAYTNLGYGYADLEQYENAPEYEAAREAD